MRSIRRGRGTSLVNRAARQWWLFVAYEAFQAWRSEPANASVPWDVAIGKYHAKLTAEPGLHEWSGKKVRLVRLIAQK